MLGAIWTSTPREGIPVATTVRVLHQGSGPRRPGRPSPVRPATNPAAFIKLWLIEGNGIAAGRATDSVETLVIPAGSIAAGFRWPGNHRAPFLGFGEILPVVVS